MTKGRHLKLAWSEHQGYRCLLIRGWTEAEFRELGGLTAEMLSRRLVVLPNELVQSGVDLSSIQPVAGRFEVNQDAVCFVPRFPFRDGLSYSLIVNPVNDTRPVENPAVWTIQQPAREGAPTTEVVAIYPSGGELPVNQLKFYAHFSSPMSEGWAARAVQVRRADNDEQLDGVFLEMEPELWDRERRRLTLLLDPGRIKRGLAPNAEAGYPLIEGVPVILTIAPEFQDAVGRPLLASVERRYEIGPPARVRVDSADWRYHFPTAGSTDRLTVEFGRPLDHALLEHCLWIHDATGKELPGRGFIGAGERRWRFEPMSPWKESRYRVIVDTRLEDLAGNSLIRVFDRDLTRAEDAPANGRYVAIEFTCESTGSPTTRRSQM